MISCFWKSGATNEERLLEMEYLDIVVENGIPNGEIVARDFAH